MTASVWDEVRRELDVWSEQRLTARFWVRDDDATETSAPLAQLHALTNRFDITIGLAVIPGTMHQSLPDYLNGDAPNFRPMCHGWKHINHGPSTRPAEFGRERPLTQLLQDAAVARKAFVRHFRTTQPIFVPPFNRISNSLTRRLPNLGFAAVSAIPNRLSKKMLDLRATMGWIPKLNLPRLVATPRIDTHIDLIDWRAQTAVENEVIARALVRQLRGRRMAEPDAPIGLLTHHLVHDGPIWRLCDELLDTLRSHDAVGFLDLADWSSQNAANSPTGVLQS
jgi:hypothetical protein